MSFPEAVEKAIDECIKNGILAEFLRKNRAEVLRVSIFEYDEEEHMRQEREESRQEGFEEGEKCGEVRIAKLIIELNRQGRTEDIVKMAADKNEPSIISRYLIDLAQSFSSFYTENHIIGEQKDIQDARLYLTNMVGTVLKQGLNLLGIEVPDKM